LTIGAFIGWAAAAAAVVVALRARTARDEAQARRADAESEREQSRARLEQAEAACGELGRERDRLRVEVGQRRAESARRGELVERLSRARRAEREFNLELREQLEHMHRAGGARGDEDGSVRHTVLRAAIGLVGAEKGLLLSRADDDGDGDLDMVTSEGFARDPEHSGLVQRFAHEVLERDRILREDAPSGRAGEEAAQVDEEIENLVAIPLYLLDRFHGVVVCANRDGGFGGLDDELLLALGDHAGAALNTQRLETAVSEGRRGTLQALAAALDALDPLRRQEAGQTAMLVRALCRRMELDPRVQEVVANAALVHDVGHIGIPGHLLLKPGPLSSDERAIVEMHPRIGHTLLTRAPGQAEVAAAVLHHHERFDGGGYPTGLAGEAIPLSARVLAVVDAYVAMLHERPFRPALSPTEALEELTEEGGGQFDPEVMALFAEEVRGGDQPVSPALANAVASALATSGLSGGHAEARGYDPLTLLDGHRKFREAVQAATRGPSGTGGLMVALVEVTDLEAINRGEGYEAGDRAILTAARGVQRAALRCGGTAYRESGRRFAVLVEWAAATAAPDLAAELHTELAIGPSVRIGVGAWQAGERADELVARARAALATGLALRRAD
jgi:GGDEF domain-containing protein